MDHKYDELYFQISRVYYKRNNDVIEVEFLINEKENITVKSSIDYDELESFLSDETNELPSDESWDISFSSSSWKHIDCSKSFFNILEHVTKELHLKRCSLGQEVNDYLYKREGLSEEEENYISQIIYLYEILYDTNKKIYKSKSLSKLQKIAIDKNVLFYSKMNKEELVDALSSIIDDLI